MAKLIADIANNNTIMMIADNSIRWIVSEREEHKSSQVSVDYNLQT